MAIDFNLPTVSTLYTSVLTYVRDNISALAKMNFAGGSNIPNGTIRWNDTDKKFEKYNSTAETWGDLATSFDMTVTGLYGMTATPAELNLSSDGIVYPPITGDSTAGRVMRQILLTIENASAAGKIKCTCASMWNGDAISAIDDITDTVAKSGFLWVSAGNGDLLTIQPSVLSGQVVSVLSANIVANVSGTHLLCYGYTEALSGIILSITSPPSGAAINIGTLVDTGSIYIAITYLTDE